MSIAKCFLKLKNNSEFRQEVKDQLNDSYFIEKLESAYGVNFKERSFTKEFEKEYNDLLSEVPSTKRADVEFDILRQYVLEVNNNINNIKEQIGEKKYTIANEGIVEGFAKVRVPNLNKKIDFEKFDKETNRILENLFSELFPNIQLVIADDLEFVDPESGIILNQSQYPVIPLQGNEKLYKKYNLLNKEGKIKKVNPNNETIKKWVKDLNQSPNFKFETRQVPDGTYRIFIVSKGLFQVNEAFQGIKGQAIIENEKTRAGRVLINSAIQSQDTLPHEYAHHYIRWFKDTEIVKEGIKRFGSEEALVQAIGEQVVKQKGEAYNWWQRFTKWLLNLMSDKEILQVLTDSFLQNRNLSEDIFEKGKIGKVDSDKSKDNKILDLELDVLNDPNVFKRMDKPLSSDPIKKWIEENYNEEITDISKIFDNTFKDKYDQGKDGGSGIGVYATLSTLLSLTSTQEEIGYSEKDLIDLILNSIDIPKKVMMLSYPYDREGNLKVDNSSVFVNASVDNEKEPLLGKIYVNEQTFGIVDQMIALGYTIDDILNFINNKTVKQFIENLQFEDVDNYVDRNSLLSKVFKDMFQIYPEQAAREGLLDLDKNAKLVYNFIKIDDKAQELRSLKSTINIDSKGLSNSLIEVQEKLDKLRDLKNGKSTIQNVESLVNNTILSPIFEFALERTQEIWTSMDYQYDSDLVVSAYEEIASLMGYDKSTDLQTSQRKAIFKELKNYIFSTQLSGLLLDDDIHLERKRLLFGKNSLANRILKAKTNTNNIILKAITIDSGKNEKEAKFIRFNNSAFEGVDEQFFRDAFNELITEDVYENIGLDLIKYSIVTNINNTPQNLVKFIPIEYYIATGAAKYLKQKTEDGKNIIFGKQVDNVFLKQFFQNNPHQAERIPDIKNIKGTKNKKGLLVSFNVNENAKNEPVFKSFYDKKKKKWFLYQKYKNKYYLINTLGNNRKGLQNKEYKYDISQTLESVYEENNIEDAFEGIDIDRPTDYSSLDERNDSQNLKLPSSPVHLSDINLNSYHSTIQDLLNSGRLNDKQKVILTLLSKFDGINPFIRRNLMTEEGEENEGRGSYDYIENEITLPVKPKNESDLIDIFIEEALHASTVLTIERYNNPKTRDSLPKEQKQFVEKIKGLRVKYLDELVKRNPEKYKKYKDGELDPTDKDMVLFYRSESDREFVIGLFQNDDIRKTLEDIPFNGSKSILDRLIEIFMDLLKAFNINLEKPTEFSEGLKAVFGIIEYENTINETQEINEIREYVEANEFTLDEIENEINLIRGRYELGSKDSPKLFSSYEDAENVYFEMNKLNLNDYPFKVYLNSNSDGYFIEIKPNIAGTKSFSPKYKKDEYDSYLEQLYDRLKFLESNINDTLIGEQTENKKSIRARIERQAEELRSDIASFQENNAIKKVKIKNIGKKQLEEVKRILESEEISAEELRYTADLLSIYSNLNELGLINRNKLDKDEYKNNEVISDLIDLQEQSTKMFNSWTTKAREYTLNYINDKLDLNLTNAQLFGKEYAETDINSLEAFTRDISNFGSPILSYIDIILKKTTSEAEFEQDKQIREIDKITQEYLDSEFGKKHKYNIFFRKDGTLVGRTVQEFFDKRGEILSKIREAKYQNDKNALNAYFKELREFNKENTTVVDVRKFYKIDEDGFLIYEENKAYEKELVDLLGSETRRDDAIEIAKIRVDDFNKDRQDKLQELEDRTTDENENEIKEELKVWDYQNNPIHHLSFQWHEEYGKKYYTNQGWKYLYFEPKEQWHDSTFNEIDANESARNYYRWFRKTLNNYYRIAPDNIYEELIQYNQIPIIPKDFINSVFASKGITAAGTTVLTKMLDVLGEKQLKPNKELGTGRAVFENKYPFVRQEFDTPEERQRRIDDSEKDLRNILVTVAKGSLLYKYVKTVEDPLKVAQKVFDEQSEIVNKGEQPKKQKALKNKSSALDYYLNTGLYGVNYIEKSWNPVIISKERMRKLNPRDKQIVKELETQLEELQNKNLTPYEFNKRKKAIETKIKSIGDEVTSKQIAKAFLQYIQLKGMGFNVLSAVNNFLFGWISAAIHASGGEDYTEKDFRKASGKMLHSTANILPGILLGGTLGTFIMPIAGTALGAGLGALISGDKQRVGESKKIGSLMKRFNVLGDIIEINDRNRNYNTNERKFSKKFGAYELQRKSEYFAYGTVMVAKLLNQKVVTEKEGEVSLYDVYDENGDLNTEKYGKIQIVNKEGKLKNYEVKDYLDLKLKIDQVNKIVHGNYDKKSPTKIKQTVIGRSLMQFRGWLPEALATRFAEVRKDEILARNRSGRYTFMFNNDRIEQPWSLVAKSLLRVAYLQNSGIYNAKYLEQHEIANLRKNVAELRFMSLMIVLPLMLKWMDDDDDEKNMLYNFAINSMFKLQNDLNFYTSPTSLVNLEKNLIPALSIVPQGIRTWNQGMKLMFDEEADERTEEAFTRNFIKMFPYGSSAYNVVGITQKVYNTDN